MLFGTVKQNEIQHKNTENPTKINEKYLTDCVECCRIDAR